MLRMSQWWSVEVSDGAFSASQWWRAHRKFLLEAAVTNGAADWAWHVRPRGLVIELEFEDETRWEAFRALPAVQAALDAVPDPVGGLAVYRGRGGSAGRGAPTCRPPLAGSSAAALPEPLPERPLEVVGGPLEGVGDTTRTLIA
jgi:hypothetical protein